VGITWRYLTLQPTPDEARKLNSTECWCMASHYLIVVFERDPQQANLLGVKGVSM